LGKGIEIFLVPFFSTLFLEMIKMENNNKAITYEEYRAVAKVFTFICKNDKKYDKDGKIVISFDSEEDLDNIIDTTWESLNKIQNELE
jgi:hypothetical protein